MCGPVQLNCLAIEQSPLVLCDDIIQGSGSFSTFAANFSVFASVLENKIVQELEAAPTPSPSPYQYPTYAPYANSQYPTYAPYTYPTYSPYAYPTPAPYSSQYPTPAPFPGASNYPTYAPYAYPTYSPYAYPTPAPFPGASNQPTYSPYAYPTPAPSPPAVDVDVELALVMDDSGSIDAAEWDMQIEGYKQAIQNKM